MNTGVQEICFQLYSKLTKNMTASRFGYTKIDTDTRIDVNFIEIGYMCQVSINIYQLSKSINYNTYKIGNAPRPYQNAWIDWGLPQNTSDPLQFSIREDLEVNTNFSLYLDIGGSKSDIIENRGMNLNKTFCYVLHPDYVNSK